jgi:hypothetical protein
MSPPIYIGEWKLRELFNRLFLPRIEAGELHEYVLKEGPAHPKYGQEPAAISQIVAYYEAGSGEGELFGKKVAVIHRYLNADGSLGASGLPDPKSLKHEGKLYVLDRPQKAEVKKKPKRGKG